MADRKKLKNRFFLSTPMDLNLILAVIFINIFGLIMIYSASYYYGPYAYGYEPDHFFMSQLKYVLPGIALMVLISFIRPGLWKTLWPAFFFAAGLLLVAVKIPGVGWASHGAYRWIKIGRIKFQIAEPVKVFLILSMAGFLTKFSIERKEALWTVILVFSMFSAGLLVLSNNMSTAMIVFLMMYCTLAVLYPKPRWFVIVFTVGVLFLIAAILLLDRIPYSETENFRITRIRAWIHPDDSLYSDDEAYQAKMALYAIASGGLFGKGFGRSLLKFSLPEPHNDYILAVVFEELGIFGVLILSYLYLYVLYRLMLIFKGCRNTFSRVTVLGVFFHIVFQVLINYGVTLGLLPTMGVTLPFVSAGGASAFFTLVELGLCLGIDRQNKELALYESAEKEIRESDPLYREIMEERREKRISGGRIAHIGDARRERRHNVR